MTKQTTAGKTNYKLAGINIEIQNDIIDIFQLDINII